ncbi:MAG: type II toxin-antitoxin system Phd/YefM family antitoxin [Limisphaerales bacterium]
MKIVDIQAAKPHLSRLVDEAAAGEQVVLAKAGRPLVQLTPFNPQLQPRKLGQLKGRVRENNKCWDRDPTLEAAFSGTPVILAKARRG